jgi:DNA-binding transcriptional ArsR family regulator
MKSECCDVQALRVRDAHVAALGALAHPARLRTFFHLVRAGREVAAGTLAAALGVPAPTLSQQLAELHRAGLVARRRSARFVYYRAARGMVSDLVRLLTNCC